MTLGDIKMIDWKNWKIDYAYVRRKILGVVTFLVWWGIFIEGNII